MEAIGLTSIKCLELLICMIAIALEVIHVGSEWSSMSGFGPSTLSQIQPAHLHFAIHRIKYSSYNLCYRQEVIQGNTALGFYTICSHLAHYSTIKDVTFCLYCWPTCFRLWLEPPTCMQLSSNMESLISPSESCLPRNICKKSSTSKIFACKSMLTDNIKSL